MNERQKQDLLIGIIVAATLPMEIETELIAFVKAKAPDAAIQQDFARGAEYMRRSALCEVSKLEDGCLGIQKAAFVVCRNAIENLEVP